MKHYRTLLLMLVFLAYWPGNTSVGDEPAGLDEIVAAWKGTVRGKDEPFWMQLESEWEKREGLDEDHGYDFDTQHESITYIYDLPVYLRRVVTYRDDQFVRESVRAANEDYAFRLSKRTEDGPYELQWLGIGSGAKDEKSETMVLAFVEAAKSWHVSFGASNLSNVIARSPEAFSLTKTNSHRKTMYRIVYDRSKAKSLSGLGRMADYSKGEIVLNALSPWLPVSMKYRFDREGVISFREETEFDSGSSEKTSTNFTMQDVPIVITQETYGVRTSNNEMLAMTRLSAYGIPEPDIPRSIGAKELILFLAGLLLFAIGYRVVRTLRQRPA